MLLGLLRDDGPCGPELLSQFRQDMDVFLSLAALAETTLRDHHPHRHRFALPNASAEPVTPERGQAWLNRMEDAVRLLEMPALALGCCVSAPLLVPEVTKVVAGLAHDLLPS